MWAHVARAVLSNNGVRNMSNLSFAVPCLPPLSAAVQDLYEIFFY